MRKFLPVKSGSFIYDIQLSLDDWIPTEKELRVLSIEMIKFAQQSHPIESLDVNTEFALDLFSDNPHKTEQIPDIAANNGGRVTLFKAGKHIDISRGPMVANTNHLGRITVTNVIKLATDVQGSPIYRFQGVALPKSIVLNHFAYGLLEERARKLVSWLIKIQENHIKSNLFDSFRIQRGSHRGRKKSLPKWRSSSKHFVRNR